METAKKYHRIKNWLFLAQITLFFAGLFFLLFSGLSVYARNKISLITQNNFLLVGLYVFILDIASSILSFPLTFYEGFILEHKFNLSAQKFSQWIGDLFKKEIISFAVFLISTEAVYLFLRRSPDNWWAYAALFWIFLSIVLAKLTPVIFIPLFFKSSPIAEGILKEKILSLVNKCGAKIKNIFIIDFSKKTKKSNAMVCGLGGSRRILLADNLVNEFSPLESAAVVAHELGHEVNKDTLRMLFASAIFSLAAFFACNIFLKAALGRFGFGGISDIAAFPLLALFLFLASLFVLPLQNGYCRRREAIADRFALSLTNDAQNFISMMEKLSAKNLADASPNKIIEFLLYDHPPIGKRIAQARRFNTGQEKRKYTRLDSVLPVDFQINLIDKAGVSTIVAWQQGFSQDVAYGGIALYAKFIKPDIAALDIDKIRVFLKLHLAPLKKIISAQARLAWIKKIPDSEGSYILGLSFDAIEEPLRRLIVNFARWRIVLPRLTLALAAALAAAFIIAYTYNLNLRIRNQALVDDLTGVSRQLSLAKDYSSKVNREKGALDKELIAVEENINLLGRKVSEMEVAPRKPSVSFSKEMAQEATSRNMELLRLKAELDNLHKDKKILEDKWLDLSIKLKDSQSLVREAEKRKLSMEKNTIEKMYAWVKLRQNSKTGLIASFIGDAKIEDWAFTYDQSLAAAAFVFFADYEQARKIFDFYKRASSYGGAFTNAYYSSGGESAEYVIHAGPNIWLGIAVLQYTDKTGDRSYLPLAEQIASWLMDLQGEDKEGGIRGGPQVSWYATEHNLDAYAFFNMLYGITRKERYLGCRDRALNWLKINSYHKNEAPPIWRGRGDSVIATDTYFWSIAAIGPDKLKAIDMDPDAIIKFAEDNCYVETEFTKPDGGKVKVRGFDFAKTRHLPRGGIISCEFSAQVVVSYKMMSRYYKNNNDPARAVLYEDKATGLLNQLEKMLILNVSLLGESFPCLPYSSAENADTGHGWFTPAGRQTGSLSATVYTIFGYYGFNPLQLEKANREQ